MGILTSALSELADSLIDMGIDTLDEFVSNEIQQGRNESAFRAIDAWENQVAQNYGLANKIQSGSFNMPGMDLAGGAGQGILPTGVDEQSLMQSFSNVPPVPPEIAKSNAAFQIFNQRYSDVLQNNPLTIQQQIQSEAQKNRLGLVKEMAGTGFQQNQMGWGETLGAFDRPAEFNLSRDERLSRLGQREAALTTGRMGAQEPFKEKAMQRSMQLKQTPGARAMGRGDEPPGGPAAGMPINISNWAYQMLSKKGNKYGTVTPPDFGVAASFQANSDGDWVVNRMNEIYQGQGKAKNPLNALNQATKDLETAKQQMKQEETNTRKQQGDLDTGAFKDFSGQKAKQPVSTPSTPTQPTAKQKAREMTDQQKIQILRERGVSEEEIRKAIQGR